MISKLKNKNTFNRRKMTRKFYLKDKVGLKKLIPNIKLSKKKMMYLIYVDYS